MLITLSIILHSLLVYGAGEVCFHYSKMWQQTKNQNINLSWSLLGITITHFSIVVASIFFIIKEFYGLHMGWWNDLDNDGTWIIIMQPIISVMLLAGVIGHMIPVWKNSVHRCSSMPVFMIRILVIPLTLIYMLTNLFC